MLKLFKNQQGLSYWAIIIVAGVMVAALIVAMWPQSEVVDDDLTPAHIKLLHKIETGLITISERAKIEKWIVDNKLNEYGDPAGTIYAGGTPLFDEATGKTISRWEYIKKKHPDAPWNKTK
jgi:hypothetical protein